MAIASTPRMITDGLILYLDPSNPKSYPGTGTDYYDLTQNDYTGSLKNGVAFSSEKNGVFRFDGTNDYIRISDNTRLRFPTSYTISYWIRIGKVLWTFGDLIISKRIDGQNINYQTYATSGSTVSTPNGYSIGFGGNTGGSFWGVSLSGSAQELAYNEWYHITGRYSSNRVDIFVNGTIVTGSSGLPNLATSTAQVNISGYSEGGNPISGSMGNIWFYNRALSDVEVFQLYETTREKYNFPETMTDEDAVKFVNAAQLRSDTQRKAINDLVVDMKNVGLWGKMKAIYPFIGGTATTHKWNLKDPRDLDAAFRLQFNGGWTHSSNGADPNGTTAWADTYLNPSTTLSAHNIGLTYYSRENTSGGTSIGADNNSSPGEYCKMRIGSGSNIGELVIGATNVGLSKFTVTNSAAYFIGSATNSTTRKIYRNGVSISFNSQETLGVNGLVNYSLPLARNGGALTYSYDDKQCAFATIGDGLTDTDAANLYTIVQKYQTTLGRQV